MAYIERDNDGHVIDSNLKMPEAKYI